MGCIMSNVHLGIPGFEAIIFDFDGVIVDSESHWDKLENPYIKDHTTGWHDTDYSQLTGMGLAEIYKLLVAKYDFPFSRQKYFDDYDKMALTLYGSVAQPVGDIGLFLDFLTTQDIKVAIASSSKPSWIDIALKRFNLDSYFSTIVSSHDKDIANGKPAPDVYLKAANKLIVSTGRTIAIEDSTNGVRSAKSAGIFCVGLDINGENSQDLSHADLTVKSYQALIEILR